ncbi:MAG: DUF983 domain-containing protein [Alphaproteobacteria bacterium]|nr:MAG: DUF983 domain-containing protein [Alphaproteobacteria bacterium]
MQTSTMEWKSSGEAAPEARNVGKSMKRGLFGRCPHCGEGKLFRAFLKPVDHCSVCNEDYTHQRADDLPAYLSIVVVGHIVVGGFMMTDMVWTLSNWTHLAIWTPLTVLLAMTTIQPIKGAVIGLQWAARMHGFGGNEPKPEDVLK